MPGKNDFVHYGAYGVCRVEDLRPMRFGPGEPLREYYVLRSVDQNGADIYVPADNPALTARAILMTSSVGYMSGSAYQMSVRGVDAISGATPLASQGGYELWQLFVGQCPGCIGEVGRVAILVGGLYLIVRRIISWRVPALMLLTLFACTWLAEGSAQAGLYAILSGGVFLAAFFMATDYATSPVTPVGKRIMGVGCGLITFVIRRFSSMPEGASYAVLIMNLTVPLIDRYTRPRVYGEVKKRA